MFLDIKFCGRDYFLFFMHHKLFLDMDIINSYYYFESNPKNETMLNILRESFITYCDFIRSSLRTQNIKFGKKNIIPLQYFCIFFFVYEGCSTFVCQFLKYLSNIYMKYFFLVHVQKSCTRIQTKSSSLLIEYIFKLIFFFCLRS